MTVPKGRIAPATTVERERRAPRWPLLALSLATALAFCPVLIADFVTWDDRHNLFGNPRMNPPSPAGVAWYWAHPYKDLYVPVTYTAWSIVGKLAYSPTPGVEGWHLDPMVFHAANLALHIGAALAAYALLRRLLGGAALPALVGAGLFALHPVQVEAVAWASGLKDVLAGLLSLAALLGYVAAVQAGPDTSRRRRTLLLATLAFILAMLAKPSAVVTPLLAAAIDALVLRRPWRNVAAWGGAGLLLAVPFILIAKLVQPAASVDFIPPLHQRPLVALDALAFYAGKLVAPIEQGIDYGRSPRWLLTGGTAQRFWTWAVPLLLAAGAVMLRRRLPLVAVGAAIVPLALLPVLGLVPFDFQAYSTVTDHYLYVALLGPALIVAALVARLPRRPLALSVAAAVLLALGVRTFVQATTWRDSRTLFEHAVAVNPTSVAGNHNLATLLHNDAVPLVRQLQQPATLARPAGEVLQEAAGLLALAEKHYRAALTAAPDDPDVHASLGNTLAMQAALLVARNPEAAKAKAGEARAHAERAASGYEARVARRPDDPSLHLALARQYRTLNRRDDAADQLRKALALDPHNPDAQRDLQTLERLPATTPSNYR